MPAGAFAREIFRRKTRRRRMFDAGLFSRSWRFDIEGAYIPRDAIRAGDTLHLRFALHNLSRYEGTIYYVVIVSTVYGEHRLLYSSDMTAHRYGCIACIPARERQCVEHEISWADLTRNIALGDEAPDEIHVAVDIEIWPPGRLRVDDWSTGSAGFQWAPRDSFQQVQLMHNPSVIFRSPSATSFLSYAWTGRRDLRPHEYRATIYRLADALSRCGLRPLIDYNFLAPALINHEVIERALVEADSIILVYSDDYVERMENEATGVGFEYGLVRRSDELWTKTIPIRLGLKEQAERLFQHERRYVSNFEEGSLAANAGALVSSIVARLNLESG